MNRHTGKRFNVAHVSWLIRSQALEHHPDKNPTRVEEATRIFTEIQAAYEILSDPQERSWYDSHKDSILRGDEDIEDDTGYQQSSGKYYSSGRGTTSDQLMRFFSPGAYTNFSDSPGAFFEVFRSLFKKLAEEEITAWELDSECINSQEPDFSQLDFGLSSTLFEDGPKNVYAKFLGFSTCKSFRWCDKYRLSDAPDRAIKRAMERENQKLRESGRKDYNETVRRIAEFAQKRDPRVKAYQEQMKEARLQKDLDLKERQKAERQQRLRQMKEYEEQDWNKTSTSVDDLIEQLPDEFEDAEENQDEFLCVACNKVFKTEKQWLNHEQSRKHIKNVEILRAQLLEEDEALAEEMENSDREFHETSSDLDERMESMTLNTDQDLIMETAAKGGELSQSDSEDTNLGSAINEANEAFFEPRLKRKAKKNKRAAQFQREDAYAGSGMTDNEEDFATKPGTVISETVNSEISTHDESANTSVPIVAKTETGSKKKSRDRKPAAPSSDLVCGQCGETFASRNKLFDHLRETSHAGQATNNKKKDKKKKK
ncbi:DnaJ sub C member 21 [Dinochytrium kinnereticum]|nr:DnaJ sub C member 21 [Dinochytrium kinnereticum]